MTNAVDNLFAFGTVETLPANGFVPDHPDERDPTIDDGPPPVPTGPVCEVCGVEIPWTGRGRRPKLCQDHRRRTSATAPKVIDSKASTQARLDAVTADLMMGAGKLAGTMAAAAPVTSVTIGHKAPPAIAALVRVASDHPKFLEGLEAVAKAAPWIEIGEFVAALILAVAVDMGRLAPVGIAAEMLGVAEAAREAGWEPPEVTQTQAGQSDRNVPLPPRFRMP